MASQTSNEADSNANGGVSLPAPQCLKSFQIPKDGDQLGILESPSSLKSTNMEKLPPYKDHPVYRVRSHGILPARNRKSASVPVIGAASAAFPSFSVIGKALTVEGGDLDDPVMRPLVQKLKSTMLATLEVSSEAKVPGKKKKRFSKKALKNSFKTKKKKAKSCVVHAQSPSVL